MNAHKINMNTNRCLQMVASVSTFRAKSAVFGWPDMRPLFASKVLSSDGRTCGHFSRQKCCLRMAGYAATFRVKKLASGAIESDIFSGENECVASDAIKSELFPVKTMASHSFK